MKKPMILATLALVFAATTSNVQAQGGKMKKKADVAAAKTQVAADKAEMNKNKAAYKMVSNESTLRCNLYIHKYIFMDICYILKINSTLIQN